MVNLETYEAQWWRALAVFRVVSLLYAAALYLRVFDDYRHPVGGWLVLAAMAVWTVITVRAYRRPRLRRWPLLTLDLLAAAAAIVVTRWLQEPDWVERGAQTLPVTWVAAPVIAWAIVYGWAAAIPAAAVVGVANVVERGAVTAALLHNTVLVLLAGATVGYVAERGRRAEAQLAAALQVQATTRERDRLARAVHDGTLQVLSLVARRGSELGGEDAALARLAGEQEIALRALLSSRPPGAAMADGTRDLTEAAAQLASPGVTISAPAAPVLLPAADVQELLAAITASLDNVRRHAGPEARAFVLIEDEGPAVVVTVRDDGIGFASGRLAQAEREGRMGVARSVRGRVSDLGGTATIGSAPGQGVEVVLRVPRPSAS